MDKWMYERITKENSEKSTEELTQEILALMTDALLISAKQVML